jgi:isopropylmalate/homocitrate/citramalate synthase
MKIIDVTLRDGGFTCDFDWPMEFAQEYYELLSELGVNLMELGYWKQTAKSKNRFFDLNMDTIKEVTKESGKQNISVMIDYSYCSKDLKDYPTDSQGEIKLIRMTCRKDMIDDGVEFAQSLKEHSNLDIAFNMFNTTNYTNDELDSALDIVLKYDFDIVGFADTHGHLDLNVDIDRYEKRFKMIKDTGKQTAFHLHNHTGKAYLNYIKCSESPYIDICDTSIMSLGKGAGNLKLENVLGDDDAFLLSDFILKHYDSLFKKTVSPYYLITGRYGITDHYATQARKNNLTMEKFSSFCKTVSGLYRDNFDKNLLEEFLN